MTLKELQALRDAATARETIAQASDTCQVDLGQSCGRCGPCKARAIINQYELALPDAVRMLEDIERACQMAAQGGNRDTHWLLSRIRPILEGSYD